MTERRFKFAGRVPGRTGYTISLQPMASARLVASTNYPVSRNSGSGP